MRDRLGPAPWLRSCRDFLEQSADPHGGNIRPLHRDPANNARQHPIGPIQRRRPRASRQTDYRTATVSADEQQISGVHRHAKMQNLTARLSHSTWGDVLDIRCGRTSENQHQIAFCFIDRVRQCRSLMRYQGSKPRHWSRRETRSARKSRPLEMILSNS